MIELNVHSQSPGYHILDWTPAEALGVTLESMKETQLAQLDRPTGEMNSVHEPVEAMSTEV